MFLQHVVAAIVLSTARASGEARQHHWLRGREYAAASARDGYPEDGRSENISSWPLAQGTGTLIAWIRFGGGGDRTAALQGAFHTRASQRNWNDGALCKVVDGDALVEGQNPPCSDEPDTAIVQADYPYCDFVSKERGCVYFTVLRNPVAKMVTQYNTNCLRCAYGGMDCEHTATSRTTWENPDVAPLPALTCPHMSFLDYARFRGNEYVAQFSDHKRFCMRTGALTSSAEYRECITEISEVDYDAAFHALNSSNVIIIGLEEASSDWDSNGLRALQQTLGENLTLPRTMKPEVFKYVPTDDEIKTLLETIQFDIRLYNEVREVRERAS